jgi:hypothetical protein
MELQNASAGFLQECAVRKKSPAPQKIINRQFFHQADKLVDKTGLSCPGRCISESTLTY